MLYVCNDTAAIRTEYRLETKPFIEEKHKPDDRSLRKRVAMLAKPI